MDGFVGPSSQSSFRTMTPRERMLAAIHGKPTDRLPWAPRMDLWAIGQRARGTLPARYEGLGVAGIADVLGVDCHAVRADFPAIPWKERDPFDFVFRSFGLENHPHFPFRFELRDLPFSFEREGSRFRTVIRAPAGVVETVIEYTDAMAVNGSTTPDVLRRVIEPGDDLEAVAQVYEHLEVVPTPFGYREFSERIGDRGLAVGSGVISMSPIHAQLHQLMRMDTFFYWWHDDEPALRRLGERMAPFFERALDAACDCEAEVILWGANYDQDTTWPPFFAAEIVPWAVHVGDRLRGAGKTLLSHCDGENDRLLPHLPACRFDVAESVCTEPMTRRSLRDLRGGFGSTTTIWGGLPAVAFQQGAMADDVFERHLERLFGELGSGQQLILGVSDNVPVDADLGRLHRVTELVRAFGAVSPRPSGLAELM